MATDKLGNFLVGTGTRSKFDLIKLKSNFQSQEEVMKSMINFISDMLEEGAIYIDKDKFKLSPIQTSPLNEEKLTTEEEKLTTEEWKVINRWREVERKLAELKAVKNLLLRPDFESAV